MKANGIITLTTDFGLQDCYVGVMKGVMLSIAPKLHLIDISHCVAPQQVLQAAFVLENSWRFFPQGTTHLVVVDPGVGTARRMLAAERDGHYFVAPDNGVLSTILTDDASVHAIENRRLFLPETSKTFHGRDMFAPVAAHLAAGMPLNEVGSKITDFSVKKGVFPRIEDGIIHGEAIYIDHFGNVCSNIAQDILARVFPSESVAIEFGNATATFYRISQSYAEVAPASPCVLFNSANLLECAVNQGNAANILGLEVGMPVTIHSA